jgi:Putative prokaryotic signal transducing protein
MKTLYEASNAIEAHMLVDLLKQEGLTAYIRGEYLQGAVGEMPAAGLVRLEIDESDFPKARAIIDRWDASQPEESTVSVAQKKSNGIYWLFVGLIIGFGGCYAFFRIPAAAEGIDHNRDGVVDEKWIKSASGSGLRYEVDRNLDSKVDLIAQYGSRGAMDSVESDDNFDGVFETKARYENGNPDVLEADTDSDGFDDLVMRYTNGVLVSQEYISSTTGRVLKIEYFKLGKLMAADVDSNKDGTFDVRYTYDYLGDLKSSSAIKR